MRAPRRHGATARPSAAHQDGHQEGHQGGRRVGHRAGGAARRARGGRVMIEIACVGEARWRKLTALLDVASGIPKYATSRERFIHRDELTADMETALASHHRGPRLRMPPMPGSKAGATRPIDQDGRRDHAHRPGRAAAHAWPVERER